MTNGEKIKATFPHYDIEIDELKGYVRIFYENFYTTYNWYWWNSEYKEPTTKNNLVVDCISREDALRVAKNEYLRGWHNALCKALREKYSIHCEEGNFSVIQEETITGLGLSMNCAVGKDVESYMSTISSVTPKIEPRKGHWREVDVNMYACSKCSHVLTIDPLDNAISEMNTCPFCGADMRESEEA